MARARRSFKLRLSPAGLDTLIDSHCHLIRTTRSLLAWGTTLHVAVEHLDTLPTADIIYELSAMEARSLGGAEEHHVGASQRLWDVATRITERVQDSAPEKRQPSLSTVYILALMQLPKASQKDLKSAFERALQSGARMPASYEVDDVADN